MPTIDRPLAGPSMTFRLSEHLAEMRNEEAYRRSGRAGRTLAKARRFRAVLLAVGADVLIGTHQTDSPMTLQVIEGGLRFRDAGGEHELRQGDLLFFGPGSAEDIRAIAESALLITISAEGDDMKPGQSSASDALS